MPTLLEMRGITKSFPGVRALDGVTFSLGAGELHALVGENGAGKSTLMKVLGGVYPYPEYEGEIVVDGRERRFRGVHDAEAAGVAVVYQELSLVKELTIGENVFLGREPSRAGFVRWEELYARTARLLDELHLDLEPRASAGALGVGRQQLVEIAKALSHDARILVLDEPTAALADAEVETLFAILERLRARGVGIVYISHRLEEVFRIADTITVLRDGRTVATHRAADLDEPRVISLMVGREVNSIFPERRHDAGAIALEARGVTVEDPDTPGRRLVDGVSFAVRRGEVLGIAGLMGAGRSDLLAALFGAHAGRVSGEVVVDGAPARIRTPSDAIERGIAFVTEDRKRFGLVLEHAVLANMTLAGLASVAGRVFVDGDRERAAAGRVARDLRVRAASLDVPAGTLSGGNQQKVVLGKWLLTEPRVLLLDEPTRGIDVGARQEIYEQIEALAGAGLAIVLVSSELPEVLGLSDRVIVLRGGRVAGEFARAEATPEGVMACAAGGAE